MKDEHEGMEISKYLLFRAQRAMGVWGHASINGIDLSNLLERHFGGFRLCELKILQTLYRLINRRSASPPGATAVEAD